MAIDIHVRITDDLAARLATATRWGVTHTVLLATRVHPERAATPAQLRAKFGRPGGEVGGVLDVGVRDPVLALNRGSPRVKATLASRRPIKAALTSGFAAGRATAVGFSVCAPARIRRDEGA